MRSMRKGSIDLVMTSPPYALHFKKEYGNADQTDYVEWFLPFAEQIKRVLKDDGSFVLNVGGAWTPGAPLRSLYHFRLLLALCDQVGFNLCQEFFWYNPAKCPRPPSGSTSGESGSRIRSSTFFGCRPSKSQSRQFACATRVQPGYATAD